MNVLLIRIVDAEGRALNAIRFSMLYKGPRVHAFYLAERVTRQLGQGDASMPLPPPSFMLFPYETLEMQLAMWRASLYFTERLDVDGDFEEYEWSLMPLLCPLLRYVLLPLFSFECFQLVFKCDMNICYPVGSWSVSWTCS